MFSSFFCYSTLHRCHSVAVVTSTFFVDKSASDFTPTHPFEVRLPQLPPHTCAPNHRPYAPWRPLLPPPRDHRCLSRSTGTKMTASSPLTMSLGQFHISLAVVLGTLPNSTTVFTGPTKGRPSFHWFFITGSRLSGDSFEIDGYVIVSYSRPSGQQQAVWDPEEWLGTQDIDFQSKHIPISATLDSGDGTKVAWPAPGGTDLLKGFRNDRKSWLLLVPFKSIYPARYAVPMFCLSANFSILLEFLSSTFFFALVSPRL